MIRTMMRNRFPRPECLLAAAAVFIALFLPGAASAQTPQKKSGNSVEQDLVHTEFGFFEAWKAKDLAYFRLHIPENGVLWGENGTLSRDEQLEMQVVSAKSCTVQGYGLSDFNVVQLVTGAYLLTYTAEQYATCSGDKLPVHVNGSSIYVFKAGQWQAIYRAQVPQKNQS